MTTEVMPAPTNPAEDALALAYREHTMTPIELGRAFYAYRVANDMTPIRQ